MGEGQQEITRNGGESSRAFRTNLVSREGNERTVRVPPEVVTHSAPGRAKSPLPLEVRRGQHRSARSGQSISNQARCSVRLRPLAVSYTHLTLPTILRV